QCELAGSLASCCSGIAELDGEAVLRCAASPDCEGEGEVCGGPADCCPMGPAGVCDEELPMLPPKRCLPTESGLAEGELCALPSSCRRGFCLPASGGEPRCAAACAADGDPCTVRTDCCDPLTRDCIDLDGAPVCAPLIH